MSCRDHGNAVDEWKEECKQVKNLSFFSTLSKEKQKKSVETAQLF